jgi:hypothetical protein
MPPTDTSPPFPAITTPPLFTTDHAAAVSSFFARRCATTPRQAMARQPTDTIYAGDIDTTPPPYGEGERKVR